MSKKKNQKLTADYLSDDITRHMHQRFICLGSGWSIRGSIAALQKCDLSEQIVYLYVIDDQQRLVGVPPIRSLLSNNPETKVADIMIRNIISVPSTGSLQEAGDLLIRHKLLAVPVLDEQNRIIGVVDLTHFTEDTLSVDRKAQVDNIFQLLGVRISLGRKVSIPGMFRERFPWLLWNIVSGLLCALIASRYELLIQEIVLLAMFMTVVLALGESVGMQAMTVTLQRMASREFHWSLVLSSLRRELSAAGLMAMGCAVILGTVAMVWKGQWTQTIALMTTVILSIMTACFLGVIVPSIIRGLRIDPKVAAGPIALACSDVCTLLYYFKLMDIIAS